jgi:dihydrofolate synthase/folylpolyglutamate synthase
MALTYQQALHYIHSFDDPYLAAIRNHGRQTWGLDPIRALLAKLGDPQQAYPVIHVAGTKGKGSTCAFITQGLIEAGLKVGLYISPHLQDWRERIQINRQPIPEDDLGQLVEDLQPIAEPRSGLSAFEITTALAFWYFARQGCQVAVIEVGLGGRLDATNVVNPLAVAITNISLDHMQLLGDTVGQIAAEKAAIIKGSVPAVSAPQVPEALEVIEKRAAEMGSPLTVVGRDWHCEVLDLSLQGSWALIGPEGHVQKVAIGLPGRFQIENAAVALAVLEEAQRAGLPVRQADRLAGLIQARWPGRFEVVSWSPLVVLDSAHNTYSVQRLVESLQELHDGSLTFVFGCMADKDIVGMLRAILPVSRRLILTRAASYERAASEQELMAQAAGLVSAARQRGESWANTIGLEAVPNVPGAVHRALIGLQEGEALCIAGSLAIAGEARTALAS